MKSKDKYEFRIHYNKCEGHYQASALNENGQEQRRFSQSFYSKDRALDAIKHFWEHGCFKCELYQAQVLNICNNCGKVLNPEVEGDDNDTG